ncbi:MAG: 23S rRNA (guanosine(2251)-2'-O)-methyltransferase RlmB [Candidatus Wallbacteria bacterium]|nr:23S rRNA (guanosine(2251)-2'-O)-methyltransferase RlmB [Candidatus Wallbacteria bacterium]
MEKIIGINAVTEALESGRRPLESLYLARSRAGIGKIRYLFKLAVSNGITCKYVPDDYLDRLAGRGHQGVVALIGTIRYEDWSEATKTLRQPVIYIDRVTDCGNLGAILRSAAAFGLEWVLLSSKESAPVNETVVKTSAGGSEYLRYARVESPLRMLEHFKQEGYLVLAAEASGVPLEKTVLSHADKVLLLLGGEDKGVRTSLLERSDHIVSIPLPGRISSLNVSVAAGILLRELCARLTHLPVE